MARNAFSKETGCTKSKSVARKYSSETGSTFKSARNVVKLTVIRKNACKKSSWSNLKWICKTGSSCVLWPTFGEIESRGRWVRKTGLRHVSTSGLASIAPGTLFFALFWPALSPYRTWTARNAFYKKTRCTKSKSVVRKYSSETEVLSKAPEMVRNVVKFIFIRKMCEKSRRQAGSSGVLWPTFDVNIVKLGNGMR